MPETRKGENVASTDPREGESRAVRSHGNQSVNGSTVTLGLIAAPDIPEKIAKELASELPDLLRSRVDRGGLVGRGGSGRPPHRHRSGSAGVTGRVPGEDAERGLGPGPLPDGPAGLQGRAACRGGRERQ